MADKRSKILETALQLFVNQGLQQTSTAQIAKESGVAVGTMYHHFKSKDELINVLFIETQKEFGAYIHFSETENQLSYKARFDLLWNKAFKFYMAHPEKFIFIHTHVYSPFISKEVRTEAREYYRQAFQFVQEGIETGVFVQLPVIVAIRVYYSNVAALIQIHIAGEAKITKEVIDKTRTITWNAMTTK